MPTCWRITYLLQSLLHSPQERVILGQQDQRWCPDVRDVVGAAGVSVVQVGCGIAQGLEGHRVIKAGHSPGVEHGIDVCRGQPPPTDTR